MKYGHKLKVKITGYDERGLCRAQAEIVPGEIRAIAVPFACLGDELDTVFVKREQGVKYCRIENIAKPGQDRIEPKCQHSGVCGGCLWQCLDYSAQLKEKENGVKNLFEKFGLLDSVKNIIPALEIWGYRNRMDYCVGWNNEIGLKEYGSWNKYLNIKDCPLLDPPKGGSKRVGEILQVIRDWMKQFNLEPWDAKFHSGNIRYVVIRDGKNTGERMINVVVFDKTKISSEAKSWILDHLADCATTILLGQQNKPTDISMAQEFEVLKGDLYLKETVNETIYKIHPNSFFQTNSQMASVLQDTVLNSIQLPLLSSRAKSVAIPDLLTEESEVSRLEIATATPRNDKIVLDLYCGLGFFGLAAAKKYPGLMVRGYELDEHAIVLAKENAVINDVQDRCEFTAAKAEDLSWTQTKADTVIIDPPRSGLHPRVIKALCEMKPETLVYVSCNYHRLENELPELLKTFTVNSITPIDMFPNTPHVEIMLHLSSRLDSQ